MTSRGLGRSVGLATVLGALSIALSGCSPEDAIGLGWPKGITPEAHDNYKLWVGALIAALVVGALVYLLLFWTTVFHRHKESDADLPRQFGYNMPLELVLTVTPFLIIAVLFYFTVVVQERIEHQEADPAVVVDVTAFQWNWKFGYRAVNVDEYKYQGEVPAPAQLASKPEGGEERVGAIRGLNPEDRTYLQFDRIETLGTSDEIPVLVLPSHTRIEFRLASADVIHAFWVPEFLFKRDVMPNPAANHSDNVFQISEIEREGPFVGRCAELCGTYHSMMNFEVRVVTRNQFIAYMDLRQSGKTNAEALQIITGKPIAVTTEPFNTRRGQQSTTK